MGSSCWDSSGWVIASVSIAVTVTGFFFTLVVVVREELAEVDAGDPTCSELTDVGAESGGRAGHCC